ncbi:MAG: ABC transporter ATP-binding protein [Bacteroidota bacterium]
MLSFKDTEIGFKEKLFTIPTLELENGKIYSLIGKNGSGKSTFFQSLLGLTPFLSGKIRFDNLDLSTINQLEKAKLIAFVASKFDGVQHLSGRDYILMGRSPYTNFLGKHTENDFQLVDLIIQELKIEHLAQKDTLKMSDGERQILSIAKALAQECKIILLDEPSAFLDYANRIKVLTLLNSIVKEKNMCVIQSSHDLELCLEYSSSFLVIDNKSKVLIELENKLLRKEKLIDLAFD